MRALAGVVLLLGASSGAVAAPSGAPSSNAATNAASSSGGVPAASSSALPGSASSAATKPAPRRAHVELGTHDLAPVPLVRGTLGGQPTWILLDTGASVHVVAGWAARKARLATKDGGGGVQDHAGVNMAGRKADLASVRIDGWGALPSGPMLVLEQDARGLGARAGIGVVLSPQLLADEHETVLLDLDAGELRVVSEDEANKALATRKADLAPKGADACGGIFTVPGAVEGQRVSLVVDTGAATSDLSSGARAARGLAKRSAPSTRRHDAASGALAMRTVRGVRVQAGEHEVAIDLGLFASQADAECPSDGDLGVDALKSCVMVFGGSPAKMRARCGK